MKKSIKFALGVVSIMTSMMVFAGKDDAVIIREASQNHVNVAKAKNLPDETSVTLTGVVSKHLQGDHYEFKDATGTISIEIDDDIWAESGVKLGDKVKLIGEVDTHREKPTDIEVVKIDKIAQ